VPLLQVLNSYYVSKKSYVVTATWEMCKEKVKDKVLL